MPDLSLTSEQELLKSTAREFVERECSLATVRQIQEEEGGFSRELWRKIAGLGWAGILIPPAHGGEGGTLTDAAVLYEEMGRGLLPSPHHSSAVLGALILLRGGAGEQKERLLPAVARGELILALACTEAGYGWGPEHVRLTATPIAGGAFVLDGTKQFVPDAGIAGQLICVARTASSADAARTASSGDEQEGLTLFLVARDAAGVQLRPMTGFVGEPLYEVIFSGVEVSPDGIIGEVHRGWEVLAPALDSATALICAYIAGASRKVYERSLAYAQGRVQFGQPIARFQRVQDHLIDMVNNADGARWTAYEAVWKLENGKPGAEEAVSVAKVVASEGFYQLCESSHHLHAGIGSDEAYGLYLYTKASRSLYHYLGDPAFHRRRLARLLQL